MRRRTSLGLLLKVAGLTLFSAAALFWPEASRSELLEDWKGNNLPEADSLRVAYGRGMFLALGGSGAIYTSFDGTAWTRRTLGADQPLHDAVYSGETFVAVGEGGAILTSPDGVSWTARRSGAEHNLRGVTYGRGVFAAVGESGVILTSPDGVAWTLRDSGTRQMLNKAAFNGGTFAAVGASGTLLTSPDGSIWTQADSGTTLHLDGVAYGKNTFIAVGEAVLTSPDGFTWTRRYLKTNHRLLGVAYGDGIFTAVADDGTILTSPEGSEWTQKIPGGGRALLAVAYGERHFISAGEGGLLVLSESSSGPHLTLSFSSFDFGNVNVGGSSTANLTLANSGSADLIIGRLTMSGANVFDFTTQDDSCSGRTLSASQNCTVQIVFSPRTTGSKSAALSVSSNDPVTPTQTVSLTGSSPGFSASSGSTGSSCFISVSLRDSRLEPWIDLLRKFRDTFLLNSELGRSLADFYYRNCPAMARFVAGHEGLREAVRVGLVPLVAVSYIALYTSPAEKILLFVLVILGAAGVWTRRSRPFLAR